MPSITSWMRLEPRSRNAEMNTSLQARVYDPLWLLARQWQFGEFQGEDNGSPVLARWRGEGAPLNRYYAGAIAPNTVTEAPQFDTARLPLETLVERENILPANETFAPAKLRLAVEAGQHFLRMLAQLHEQGTVTQDYRAAFIRQYPFSALTPEQRATLDGDSLSYFELMAARVPDGRRLRKDFRSTSQGQVSISPALQIAGADIADVREAARVWLEWLENFFNEPDQENPTWLPERLEYAFSVGARFNDSNRVLTAPEYFEGRLDWYGFDANAEVMIGKATDDPPSKPVCTAIPAPVSFRGMPAPRFWQFEDAQVDFGSVEAGPTDLLRMLLVEFALTYGNDWFVIPVELQVGSLYRTRSLVITDTFDVRTLIKPSSELGEPHASWRMFQHSNTRSSGLTPEPNLFFLTPSLIASLESQPIEEVLFLRDEMANMAWGIERTIESASEQALNRFEEQRIPPSPTPPPAKDQKLIYRVETEVPNNWIPLLPVRSNDGLRLQRAKVQKLDGSAQFVAAQGHILNPGSQSLRIFPEEIPREGVRVTRHYQFARWHDGASHLWIGRRKEVGSGEGSSGLRFDTLE